MDTNLQLHIGTGGGTVLSILGSLGLGDSAGHRHHGRAAVSFGVICCCGVGSTSAPNKTKQPRGRPCLFA